MYQKLKGNKKGFTLAELLIVVAIIAVLVAIAIPAFSGSLDRARHATDLANIRSAYAEAVVDYLENGNTIEIDHLISLAEYSDVTLVSDPARVIVKLGSHEEIINVDPNVVTPTS